MPPKAVVKMEKTRFQPPRNVAKVEKISPDPPKTAVKRRSSRQKYEDKGTSAERGVEARSASANQRSSSDENRGKRRGRPPGKKVPTAEEGSTVKADTSVKKPYSGEAAKRTSDNEHPSSDGSRARSSSGVRPAAKKKPTIENKPTRKSRPLARSGRKRRRRSDTESSSSRSDDEYHPGGDSADGIVRGTPRNTRSRSCQLRSPSPVVRRPITAKPLSHEKPTSQQSNDEQEQERSEIDTRFNYDNKMIKFVKDRAVAPVVIDYWKQFVEVQTVSRRLRIEEKEKQEKPKPLKRNLHNFTGNGRVHSRLSDDFLKPVPPPKSVRTVESPESKQRAAAVLKKLIRPHELEPVATRAPGPDILGGVSDLPTSSWNFTPNNPVQESDLYREELNEIPNRPSSSSFKSSGNEFLQTSETDNHPMLWDNSQSSNRHNNSIDLMYRKSPRERRHDHGADQNLSRNEAGDNQANRRNDFPFRDRSGNVSPGKWNSRNSYKDDRSFGSRERDRRQVDSYESYSGRKRIPDSNHGYRRSSENEYERDEFSRNWDECSNQGSGFDQEYDRRRSDRRSSARRPMTNDCERPSGSYPAKPVDDDSAWYSEHEDMW